MPRTFLHFTFSLLTFLIFCDIALALFDPISLSLIAGGASLLYKRDAVWEYSYCQFKECCIDSHIPADMTGILGDDKTN